MARGNSKRIKAIIENDLLTHDGRLSALQDIARMCIEGYINEVVIQKTGTIEPAIKQDPATAISAIRAIDALQTEDSAGVSFVVNILESNPEES